MIDLDVKKLQAIADAVSPGLATVTLSIVNHPVHEPDRRRGFEGRNRCAIRKPCTDCKSAGHVVAADGHPDRCDACDGLGELHEDPTVPVQHVNIDIGHRASTSFDCHSHVDGVHKGRRDLFRDLTVDEVEARVRQQVGFAAFESHHHDEVSIERKHELLDAAHASGAFDPARIVAARAALVDGASLKLSDPAMGAITYVRTCVDCKTESASVNLDSVVRATQTCHNCQGENHATERRRVTGVARNSAGIIVNTLHASEPIDPPKETQ